MAKRSEIQAQIEALQNELDKAEDDGEEYEVWVKDNGREYKLVGERAKKVLGRWSDLWEDEGAKVAKEAKKETEEKPPPKTPRKQAEKKDEPEPEEEPEIEREDVQPSGYFRRK